MIKINRESLLKALKDFDRGTMTNRNHWHLLLDPKTGECWVGEDTSYTISAAEFEGREGAEITLRHQGGYGEYDTANYNSPEEAADDAEDQGIYEDEADEIIQEMKKEYSGFEKIEVEIIS